MPSVVTKSDLVHAAARAGNLSKTAAGEAVNAVFDAIVASVAKGNRVTVVGFGIGRASCRERVYGTV